MDPGGVVPIPPDSFMAFSWETGKQDEPEEITDEMMKEFDRRMDSWTLKSREMIKND
jgi:hypothetical protein